MKSYRIALMCAKKDPILDNVSQLAGFAKRDDLRFFLKALCGIDYLRLPILAPSKELLDAYRKNGGDWLTFCSKYATLFLVPLF
jgi:hypothetical protein